MASVEPTDNEMLDNEPLFSEEEEKEETPLFSITKYCLGEPFHPHPTKIPHGSQAG